MMKRITFGIIFTGIIGIGLLSGITSDAEEQLSCNEGEVTVVGTTNTTPRCVPIEKAEKWERMGFATILSDKTEPVKTSAKDVRPSGNPLGVYVKSDSIQIKEDQSSNLSVFCDANDGAMSGGYHSHITPFSVTSSIPNSTENQQGWTFRATNTSPNDEGTFFGYVVCLDIGSFGKRLTTLIEQQDFLYKNLVNSTGNFQGVTEITYNDYKDSVSTILGPGETTRVWAGCENPSSEVAVNGWVRNITTGVPKDYKLHVVNDAANLSSNAYWSLIVVNTSQYTYTFDTYVRCTDYKQGLE